MHLLEQKFRTSGFHNASRWFGLVYRDMRLSMLLQPELREVIREQRREVLAAWKEFAARFVIGGVKVQIRLHASLESALAESQTRTQNLRSPSSREEGKP